MTAESCPVPFARPPAFTAVLHRGRDLLHSPQATLSTWPKHKKHASLHRYVIFKITLIISSTLSTQVKRAIGTRRRQTQLPQAPKDRRTTKDAQIDVRHIPQAPSSLFFNANTSLKPPYQILLDTNFFAHSIRAKTDVETGLMDLLLAKCIPIVTDCVLAELE